MCSDVSFRHRPTLILFSISNTITVEITTSLYAIICSNMSPYIPIETRLETKSTQWIQNLSVSRNLYHELHHLQWSLALHLAHNWHVHWMLIFFGFRFSSIGHPNAELATWFCMQSLSTNEKMTTPTSLGSCTQSTLTTIINYAECNDAGPKSWKCESDQLFTFQFSKSTFPALACTIPHLLSSANIQSMGNSIAQIITVWKQRTESRLFHSSLNL